jgi:3D-(3,5/4)-trihydroxycyclohexane-1,2-dione acylhydrolase (decyclizing)
LSESVGAQRFGTRYRYRTGSGLDGDVLPVDLAANAASLGADVLTARTAAEFREALVQARAAARTTVVHVETDPLRPAPDGGAWWDVPVAEVSDLDTVREARARYEKDKQAQRPYL